MNKEMSTYVIYEPVYKKQLTLLIGSSKNINTYLNRRYKITMDLDGYSGMQWSLLNKKNGTTEYFIWLEEFDWTILRQKQLVHEIMHHVCDVMRNVGITLSESSEEAYTYYLEHIFAECWVKLKPNK